jgi:hypothetical protein
VLSLAAAAVVLAALGAEYPGWTRAGMRVAVRDVLPLAVVPWLHLAALAATAPGAPAVRSRRWLAASLAADLLLFAHTAPELRPGAPPVAVALPVIAALLAATTLGLAWAVRPR